MVDATCDIVALSDWLKCTMRELRMHSRLACEASYTRWMSREALVERSLALHERSMLVLQALPVERQGDLGFRSSAALRRAAAPRGEAEPLPPRRGASPPGGPLSEREIEVAALVADGLTNAEIGRRLFLTSGTVANHVRRIMLKLHGRSRVDVARWYLLHYAMSLPDRPIDPPPCHVAS